uniref:Uncharacterized protein n=1 Tax=Rhizophora mucronata TaxID=61149 RepID=A0A2P2NQ09_RHIMU
MQTTEIHDELFKTNRENQNTAVN